MNIKKILHCVLAMCLLSRGFTASSNASSTSQSTPPPPPGAHTSNQHTPTQQQPSHSTSSAPPPPHNSTSIPAHSPEPTHHTQHQASYTQQLGPISILNDTKQDMAVHAIHVEYSYTETKNDQIAHIHKNKNFKLGNPIHLPPNQVTMFNLQIHTPHQAVLQNINSLHTTQGILTVPSGTFKHNTPLHLIKSKGTVRIKP